LGKKGLKKRLAKSFAACSPYTAISFFRFQAVRYAVAPVYHLLAQFGICQECRVVSLYLGVGQLPLSLGIPYRLLLAVRPDAVLKYLFKPAFPYPFSEVDEIARVEREPVLETPHLAEVLHVRVHHLLFRL
jgi:hypothetical protein